MRLLLLLVRWALTYPQHPGLCDQSLGSGARDVRGPATNRATRHMMWRPTEQVISKEGTREAEGESTRP